MSSGYVLWGRRSSSNTQKVLWCLGELGLEASLRPTGGRHGGLQDERYLALNPNGRVPTLEDSASGWSAWDSNAIVRYLCGRYGAGGLWPRDERVRARADQWMEWQQTTLRDAILPVFNDWARGAQSQPHAPAIAAARQRTLDLFARFDRALASHAYVAGDDLSMGDIPMGVWTQRFYALAGPQPALVHLQAWHARLRTRPAYRAAVPETLDLAEQ